MRLMFLNVTKAPWRMTAVLGASILLFSGAITSSAQAPMAPMPSMAQPAAANGGGQNKQLTDQIAELRAQVARLQAAVEQSGSGNKSDSTAGMAMGTPAKSKPMAGMAPAGKAAMPAGGGGMSGMGGMPPAKAAMPAGGGGMMGMMGDKGEMGGMSGGGMAAMAPPAPAPAMGMCCMGEMGGMSGGAMPPKGGMAAMSAPTSAMPGQPGASHLYHIGSTGFFLNHSQHITLTADQKYTLYRLKERAMMERASEQRKIDQSEQDLYTLTGADQLDNAMVQAKIGEIEKLRSEQRMNFIRAVGEASNVLTHDQHLALMGTMSKK